MRLWEKGQPIDQSVLAFTAGDDPQLDLQLIEYDCRASMVHARMLERIGVLRAEEAAAICAVLAEIIQRVKEGTFSISPEEEDAHTAIENYLTQRLGDTGKKIHTARSRNDQVVTALRLFYREQLDRIEAGLQELLQSFQNFSRKWGNIPVPGYTHMRKAMPTTIATWVGAYQAAMVDNRSSLRTVQTLLDQCPAGSGAGYGIPLNIDRDFLARELGFSRIQENPLYVQNSRGKLEGEILHVLSNIQLDLNRLSSDLIFFTLPELGYIELPDAFTTGSSIMPHKKNPDVLELIRAYAHRLLALELEVRSLTANLISGYHRDLQLTKAAVFQAFSIVGPSLEMMVQVFHRLKVNHTRCQQALTPELFATEAVYRLVEQGVPFREAYRQVAAQFRKSR